jgi:prepilin-type N-terminal cleavage/methylation domain-containing protein
VKPIAHSKRRGQRQRGFTLVEALIAMAVTAFGMLALAGMQVMLARNADIARQRGEATRLAQQQIETMRSYTSIAAASGQLAWDDLANGSDGRDESNVAFARAWTIAGTTTDPMRRVSVTVSWTDRANVLQSLTLNSVISQTDPADVGALGFPLPANTTLKRPMNRNINIPVPAISLGDGRSLSRFSNFAVIFSNDSGYVVQRCDPTASAADLSSCVDYEAYIIAGYVSKTMTAFPSTLGVNTAGLTGYDTSRAIECSFDTATDQTTNTQLSDYKYYLCVIPVVSGGTWSGTMRLSGMASGTNYLVCRMQYPASAGGNANARNVQPYAGVDDSIDNQNYIITTSGSCPTVSSLATTLHQDCRGSNAARATTCPAS